MNSIIDLHCHPTLKPYNNSTAKNIKDPVLHNQYCNSNEEFIIYNNPFLKVGAGVAKDSQANMQKLKDGNVKIICASLFSYERGFADLRNVAGLVMKPNLIECLTGINQNKLDVIKRAAIDTFHDIAGEFQYLWDQVQWINSQNFNFKVRLVQPGDFKNLSAADIDNGNTVYILISVEGVQSLGITPPDHNAREVVPLTKDELDYVLLNIDIMKADSPAGISKWNCRPLYINLCHHFCNRVVGHARSLLPMMKNAFYQEVNLDAGISTQGKTIIRKLLDNRTGKRIFVDIKHMSAKARKEYYAMLKSEYATELAAGKVPIICSHTGISQKYNTLSAIDEHVDDDAKLNGCYMFEWSINLTQEDLLVIQSSKGIVGIQFDLKRLASKATVEDIHGSTLAQNKIKVPKIIWANVFTAISKINNKAAWDLLAIGTDNDGLVSYLPGYDDATRLDDLKLDMLSELKKPNYSIIEVGLQDVDIKRLMFGYTPEQICDKLFFENAFSFLKKQY